MLPKILAIVGPTASGKTALGIELAKQFNGEIISVDSRQVYRGMDIGTGKEDVGWGIDLIDPDHQNYSVAEFKEYAEGKIEDIFGRENLPILVGGTGLWIQAIVDNLTFPDVAPDLTLRAQLDKYDTEDLYDIFVQLDPAGALRIQKENKRRLIRAIEVCWKLGKPFFEVQKKNPQKYEVLQLGMKISREKLDKRIDTRVDKMFEEGLVEEVRRLQDRYGCDVPAMSGIGYQELCVAHGLSHTARTERDQIELNAKLEIKKHTRQYAKRQMSWFKRDKRIVWVEREEDAIGIIQRYL